MKTPILDHRSKPELMAQFARMAAEYVPEWHYTGDPTDPGAALAELFGEMFSQTIDRFNAVPGKLYTEFLDLLGVKLPAVTSAEGLVQFFVHEGVEETVPVPAGSMLFALDESGDHIVYETERPISATPARLEAVYYADGKPASSSSWISPQSSPSSPRQAGRTCSATASPSPKTTCWPSKAPARSRSGSKATPASSRRGLPSVLPTPPSPPGPGPASRAPCRLTASAAKEIG